MPCIYPQKYQELKENESIQRWRHDITPDVARFGHSRDKPHDLELGNDKDICLTEDKKSDYLDQEVWTVVDEDHSEEGWVNVSVGGLGIQEQQSTRLVEASSHVESPTQDVYPISVHTVRQSSSDFASQSLNSREIPVLVIGRFLGKMSVGAEGVEILLLFSLARVVLGLSWKIVKEVLWVIPCLPLFGLWQQLVIAFVVSGLRLGWRCWAMCAWAWRLARRLWNRDCS